MQILANNYTGLFLLWGIFIGASAVNWQKYWNEMKWNVDRVRVVRFAWVCYEKFLCILYGARESVNKRPKTIGQKAMKLKLETLQNCCEWKKCGFTMQMWKTPPTRNFNESFSIFMMFLSWLLLLFFFSPCTEFLCRYLPPLAATLSSFHFQFFAMVFFPPRSFHIFVVFGLCMIFFSLTLSLARSLSVR